MEKEKKSQPSQNLETKWRSLWFMFTSPVSKWVLKKTSAEASTRVDQKGQRLLSLSKELQGSRVMPTQKTNTLNETIVPVSPLSAKAHVKHGFQLCLPTMMLTHPSPYSAFKEGHLAIWDFSSSPRTKWSSPSHTTKVSMETTWRTIMRYPSVPAETC